MVFSATAYWNGWLDSLQRPDNGLWHENVDYYGANGVHKMSWIYGTKRKIPYVDKALDSIMTVVDKVRKHR